MVLHSHSGIKTDYPFLAYPPQKKWPVQPLPAPPSPSSSESILAQPPRGLCCRSSTSSSIAAWAAHVQPGTPVSISPHRRPSLSRSRRPSIPLIRTPSASFFNIVPPPNTAHTVTPSIRDFKPDLTSLGYTSVFLQLPRTPLSATLAFPIKPSSPDAAKNIIIPPVPSPTCKPRSFIRCRSLSALRTRHRSKFNCADSPIRMKSQVVVASTAITKRKKVKYGMRPPPLANELALMQFADGGCMDDNVKRVMKTQAQAAGVFGRADVHRDGKGGIWWDYEEEWEYAHLLAEGGESRPRATGDIQWVTFGGNTSPLTAGLPAEERRGSVSTQDSDLDPKYMVDPLDGDDLAVFGSAVVPVTTCRSAVSVPSVTSRPRRAAKHLRKSDFLVDAAFSRRHASPKSPKSLTPSGPCIGTKPKGKVRRRPAPLKLSPPSPASKLPINSPINVDKARRDFIDGSFEPLVPVSDPVTPTTAVSMPTPVDSRSRFVGGGLGINATRRTVNDSLGMKRKPLLNMMGLFRSAQKENVVRS